MTATLLDLFLPHPQVTVHAARDAFRFASRGREVYVRTRLSVDTSKGRPSIVAVGEPADLRPGVVSVDLFPVEPSAGNVPDGPALLNAFCSHGLRKLSKGWSVVLRPVVVVEGAESLNDVFHGWQHAILTQALESSGALSVRFAEQGRPYQPLASGPSERRSWRLQAIVNGGETTLLLIVFACWLAVVAFNWLFR